MPITPKFSLSQDDNYVYVKIRVPYIKVSSAELIVDDNDFSFYCKPYLLKLSFPHSFVDDERCKGVYDMNDDNGTITAHLPKANVGEFFEDLDMISILLRNKVTKDLEGCNLPPSIEVISSEIFHEIELDQSQELHSPIDASIVSISRPTYGFNNKYSNFFVGLREVFSDVIEVTDPDKMTSRERRDKRISEENRLFNPDRYLADLHGCSEDSYYTESMAYNPWWCSCWSSWTKNISAEEAFDREGGFSDSERMALAALPRNELLTSRDSEKRALLLGLLDLLFSACYEYRTTQGEATVESAHTATRLSALLSWLEDYHTYVEAPRTLPNLVDAKSSTVNFLLAQLSMEDHSLPTKLETKPPYGEDVLDVINTSAKRSLIYPYMRVWSLCRRVLADVTKVSGARGFHSFA